MTESDLIEKIAIAIRLNETNGQTNLIYQFSDPDGSGRSGYSFGSSQFDVLWYPKNKIDSMLSQMGLKSVDIVRIRAGDNINDLQKIFEKESVRKLVDKFDKEHTAEMFQYIRNLEPMPKIHDAMAFASLVDLHNQFYLSYNGKTHKWLCTMDCVDSEDVLEFKLKNYKWGKERPDDVWRRYWNIVKIFRSIEPIISK